MELLCTLHLEQAWVCLVARPIVALDTPHHDMGRGGVEAKSLLALLQCVTLRNSV